MRAIFLLLVLANLVYFAYAHVARDDARGGEQIARLQIAPERIRLLGVNGQAPGSPRAAPAACMEWGILAGPAVARAETALADLALPADRLSRVVTDAGGFWVYMPPLKTKAEVDRKVAELKGFGVTEFFVVQEPGQWRNAISLGIFRTEDAAQGFLEQMRKRGVRSAVMTRRENFLKQVAFYVREPGEEIVARLTLIQQDFPGTELKAGPCPPAKS
jgi:hypothetical protein